MSDSVSGRCTALKNDQKKRDSKEPYNVEKEKNWLQLRRKK